MDDASVPSPPVIHTFDMHSAMNRIKSAGNVSPAILTWVANKAVYVPMSLKAPYVVRRAFWFPGSTITTTNADFGIYAADGTRIYSTGSVAIGTALVPTFTTLATPLVLPAGLYYFAWACNNTASRGYGATVTAISQRLSGVLAEAAAFPLPATMTPVAQADALYPLVGVTRT